MRRGLPLLAVTLVLLLASPAVAQSSVNEVATALRRDALFVDPSAERALSDEEAEQIRQRIIDAGRAVYVAVLPSSMASGSSAESLLLDLARTTGLSGTYAIVIGNQFRATSTEFARADEVASAAFQARRDEGTAAVLDEFVGRVASGEGAAGDVSTPSRAPASPAEDGESGSSSLPLVFLGAGGAGLFVWWRRRRAREHAAAEAELAADRQMLQAELSVLADDVMRLEDLVVTHPGARNDYDAGVERYRAAHAAIDYADEPIDLVRVRRVVDEGRYAMQRARAIVEGREPPPPPADLRQPGRHGEPPLDTDDDGRVVYMGGGPFYGGGWFGGGGLFSGLLLGSMLGGFGGWGGGDHYEINQYGESGSFDAGGGWGADIGGGDWGGGGDVGGGDW